jgi:glutathione-independent formaldehyde dehydrogenase
MAANRYVVYIDDAKVASGGFEQPAARTGNFGLRVGLAWPKAHSFRTTQTTVPKYHRALIKAALHDRIQIAKAVSAMVMTQDFTSKRYAQLD